MDARPVILIVDDEVAGLAALEAALSRRYGADYRVAAFASARAAIDEAERIAAAGERVALVVAAQAMRESSGIEVLGRVHQLDPGAQRALLVAWGDRVASRTILRGCAFGQLDNYVVKPWFPPEVHLYPLVGEFLAEWARSHGPRMELVRVVGDRPSARIHELHELLERSGVPHGIYAAGTEEGQRVLDEIGRRGARLPVVALLDGRVLVCPSNAELSDAIGTTELDETSCDLAIVGAGPAGLAAAVYGASEGLRTIVIEREVVGGQAGTSSLIRNYLGFPRGISGAELAQRAWQQAWLFGAKYALARAAVALRAEGDERVLRLEGGLEITARAVLVASGAAYRRLEVPELEPFVGAGLYYAAGGEVAFMKGRRAFVVGGGNGAGQAAAHLAKSGASVTLVVRAGSLERAMSAYLIGELERLPNVSVRLGTEVVGGGGDMVIDHVVLRDRATGARETVECDALFVLIGALPHTEWLGASVARDRQGYVLTGRDVEGWVGWRLARPPMRFETSLPGVFACGDVRSGSVKRVASAVGEGAIVLRDVHDYLRERRPRATRRAEAAAPASPGALASRSAEFGAK